MRLPKPNSQRTRTIIKIGLWSGIVTWIVCSLIFSVLLAIRFYHLGPSLFRGELRGELLGHWVGPIWVIFTTVMFIWAIIRFTNKKFRSSASLTEFSEKDIKAIARNRFWAKYQWGFIAALFVLTAVLVFVELLLPFWVSCIPIVIFIGLIIWAGVLQRKWEKELVNEWKNQQD